MTKQGSVQPPGGGSQKQRTRRGVGYLSQRDQGVPGNLGQEQRWEMRHMVTPLFIFTFRAEYYKMIGSPYRCTLGLSKHPA